MKKIILILLVFILGDFTAIAKEINPIDSIASRSFLDVCYKVLENGDSLFLDLFLPKIQSEKYYPTLIMIHGGAWVEGSKEEILSYQYSKKLMDTAIQNGFAIVNINYRLLTKECHFPAPIVDCKDAIRWVKKNAGKYHIDTTNIGLWGASAGSHLALLAHYSPADLWNTTNNLNGYSAKVNYIIDNFGPVNLNKLFKTDAGGLTVFFFKTFLKKLYVIRNKLIFGFTGMHLKGNKVKVDSILRSYSPPTYIQNKTIPTLIIQGTKDRVVPYKQSKKLNKLLEEKDADCELIKVKGGDHGFHDISKEELNKLVYKSLDFMLLQLKE